ncbi:MAG TPA: copper resistance system multicopper oxidase [Gammaproteobacteria bacterium]|nr:copper resistance system multicopper oxidase [Gammaproteobacteria bacterium]
MNAFSRRSFIEGLGASTAAAALLRASWARGAVSHAPQELRGTEFDLAIGERSVSLTDRTRPATVVNGSLPAPTLRWREGDTVTIRVRNELKEPTSIHWHGLVLPANMDGVPGLSFHGVAPGETFTYRFPVRQSGTYWYHSHSAFQEQTGLYGALVIDPREPERFTYDREHVVLLSDWTDRDPLALYLLLKRHADYFDYQKRTLGDFARDARRDGFKAALAERGEWARMRMSPSDLADVSGAAYTYLANGRTPAGNWTGLYRPGERVRLRFINGSAMSTFDVRIPGLAMTVVAADGQNVEPVTIDEFRIATAETFDVLVTPAGADAFTIFAQSLDRTGYARGTLAVREGLEAPVPDLDRIVYLTMAEIGHGAAHTDHAATQGSAPAHADHAPSVAAVDHSQHGSAAPAAPSGPPQHPASEHRNPGVDMQAATPAPRLADPGVGLRDNGRRVLTYADLRSTFADPDGREPERTIELHLTGHMDRFMWSFDGIPFASAEPLRLRYGERLRVRLVNDTMMSHPIHLHGMWSDLEDEAGAYLVRKHTVNIPPGTVRSYRVTADALGRWAYHCHLLFHMEAGMFREVRVDA